MVREAGVGRVTVHIEGARGWLERAARAWETGSRARALLDLSLAEAEVRLARQLALSEPLPVARRHPAVLLAVLAAAAAVALAGGLRWPAATVPEKATAHAAGRAVSLGYVPGSVLALVSPSRQHLVARPWTVPSGEEVPLWIRDLLREAGLDSEGLPVEPVSLR